MGVMLSLDRHGSWKRTLIQCVCSSVVVVLGSDWGEEWTPLNSCHTASAAAQTQPNQPPQTLFIYLFICLSIHLSIWCTSDTKIARINWALHRLRLPKWAETGVHRWIQLHLLHPDSRQNGTHPFLCWMTRVRPSKVRQLTQIFPNYKIACSLKKERNILCAHTHTHTGRSFFVCFLFFKWALFHLKWTFFNFRRRRARSGCISCSR